MSQMPDFKYQIGDMVIHKSHEGDAFPIRWVVTERIAQECPGGVQLKYRCNGSVHSGSAHQISASLVEAVMLEVELLPAPQILPVASIFQEMQKELVELRLHYYRLEGEYRKLRPKSPEQP